MYTLAVEIHGLRQLERLRGDLVTDIRRRIIAVVEVQGGSFAAHHGGLWVFRFERSQPDDRHGVLEALAQTTAVLQAREDELAGWSVVLDYLELSAADAIDAVHEALLPVYEDNATWLGETAHALLAHQLEVEDLTVEGGSLYRVVGLKGAAIEEVGSVLEYARYSRAADAVVDALSTGDLVGRMLLVVCEDPHALRANTRSALETLTGSSPAVRWLEAEPVSSDPATALASIFTPLDLHETPFWLNDAERGSWEERASLIEAIVTRNPGRVLPDAFAIDFLIALESFLLSYIRRAAASVVPPVLICHRVDLWAPAATDALVRIVGRLPVPEGQPALTLVGTSSRALSGAGIPELVGATVRLNHRSVAELRELSGVDANWERIVRVTRGRSAPVVHYLSHARHWDSVTEAELEHVEEGDLAWRVIDTEDSETRELILAAYYAGPFVTREQFTAIAVRLGIDRIRVPTALSRLRLLGLLEDREQIVPVHPDLCGRLETALGRSASTVREKVSRGLVELANSGQVPLGEELVRFLGSHEEVVDLSRLYHGLLTRVLDERRLDDAQRLLYDVLPPRGGGARACMQAVIATNRIRLALLQGNAQSAARTRAHADRSGEPDGCDAVVGDLAVQKARMTFRDGPSRETVALLKRAVMIYQGLEDQTGLARANLDFGIVLLAQENLLGAREYVLLAGKAAANSNDVFEQMRSRQLALVCEYIYGNLSRSLAQATELDELAGGAGMREVQLFAELARGRTTFELGRYDEAADIFSRGRTRARLYGMTAPRGVMERWLARALVYDGRVKRGLSVLDDHPANAESAYFRAEALLRVGEHAAAIEALESGLTYISATAGPAEGIGWESGFASLEDRAIGVVGGTRVLPHEMMALRGYILAESGRVAEGVEEMHRLTRELRVSEIDPYNRVYFYLYSLILPESGELNVEDGTTVLGKAVRYIQQRTSRMDEYAHKTDYLRRNYWNARLMSHAQVHNLV